MAMSSRYDGGSGRDIEKRAERMPDERLPDRRADDVQTTQAGAAVADWPQTAVYRARRAPNFAALHALWAQKLAAARAAVHRRLTVPKV